MNRPLKIIPEDMENAVAELREAAGASKCYQCGCLHGTLKAIDEEIPGEVQPESLRTVISEARSRLRDVKYDCLGCEVCWPANAVNMLGIEGDACPTEPIAPQDGWPPLPGDYLVQRYHAPVAVCTLTDQALMASIAEHADSSIAIVGTMFTENLGIERLVENVLANPNIRFVLVCGADSGQQIGHLAGQSLIALSRNGIDDCQRIIGARGKRPRIKNLTAGAIDHFCRTAEVIDMVGATDTRLILQTIEERSHRNPGPAPAFAEQRLIPRISGRVPDRMTPDPNGYFVIYPDQPRGRLLLEHYHNSGVLNCVIEGAGPAALYTTAIERGLVSRLDHACYLGKELARADRSLLNGESFVQDAAPEGIASPLSRPISGTPPCSCGSSCGDNEP